MGCYRWCGDWAGWNANVPVGSKASRVKAHKFPNSCNGGQTACSCRHVHRTWHAVRLNGYRLGAFSSTWILLACINSFLFSLDDHPHAGETSRFLESASEICWQIVGVNLVAKILRRAARLFVSVRSWKELRYQGSAAGSEEHAGRWGSAIGTKATFS